MGASQGRQLGIPGEDRAGVHTAADFVGWYNSHPDYAEAAVDLSGTRAVIIGNGNVALDIARILLMNPEDLLRTDISDHALAARSGSTIEEVVIVGRRSLREAAFSLGEFAALGHLADVDVVIDDDLVAVQPDDDLDTAHKLTLARDYQSNAASRTASASCSHSTAPRPRSSVMAPRRRSGCAAPTAQMRRRSAPH